MNILSEILGGGNQAAIENVSKQFGLSEADTQKGLAGLLPSLMKGMQSNIGSEQGSRALLEAIEKGTHDRYLQSNHQFDGGSITDGNNILGHLLGNKERSREVAGQAASATGLSSTILKKLLPVAASILMGTLSKKSSGGLLGSLLGGSQKQQSSGFASFLDFDNDGSIADDLFKIATKFL